MAWGWLAGIFLQNLNSKVFAFPVLLIEKKICNIKNSAKIKGDKRNLGLQNVVIKFTFAGVVFSMRLAGYKQNHHAKNKK